MSLVVVAAIATIVAVLIVPIVVKRGVRARLDDAGFAHARFTVGDIALDRVELLDVSLQQGLDLGDISIHAGPYQLWRGDPADVVMRGARIDLGTSVTSSGVDRSLPFGRITVEDSEAVIANQPLSIRGTIDLRGRAPVLDLVARAAKIQVGSIEIEDVAVKLAGSMADLRGCATGTVTMVQIDACVTIDATTARTATLVWAAHDEQFTASGRGALLIVGENVVLDHGTIDATLAATQTNDVSTATLGLHADVTADLASQSFTMVGQLRTDRLETRGVVLRDLVLPIALAGIATDGVSLHSEHALAMSATSATVTATGRSLRIDGPTLRATGMLELAGVRVSAETRDTPFEIATTLRGVSVDHLVAMATRDHVRATGLFDGDLVFGLDAHGLSLVGGSLVSRGAGTLRAKDLADVTPRGFAVHRRVAAALADFGYSHLALAVDDNASVRVSLTGRGNHTPQELVVDVNVRGLLARRSDP